MNSHPLGSTRSSPGRGAAKSTLDGEDRSGIIQGEGKGGATVEGITSGPFGASEPGGETFPQYLPRRDPDAPPVDGLSRCEGGLLRPLDRIEGQREVPCGEADCSAASDER